MGGTTQGATTNPNIKGGDSSITGNSFSLVATGGGSANITPAGVRQYGVVGSPTSYQLVEGEAFWLSVALRLDFYCNVGSGGTVGGVVHPLQEYRNYVYPGLGGFNSTYLNVRPGDVLTIKVGSGSPTELMENPYKTHVGGDGGVLIAFGGYVQPLLGEIDISGIGNENSRTAAPTITGLPSNVIAIISSYCSCGSAYVKNYEYDTSNGTSINLGNMPKYYNCGDGHFTTIFFKNKEGLYYSTIYNGSSYHSGEKWCFVAGTKVFTPSGYKNIEEMQIGDIVYSMNLQTMEVEEKAVERLKITENACKLTYLISTGTDYIESTQEHRFYVKDRGWVDACELEVGDILIDEKGNDKAITDIQTKTYDEPVTVYNFEVEDNRNYFVGEDNILVYTILDN